MQPDWQAAMAKSARYVVFNGRAFQYKDNPLKVDVGDRVRFFVVNAGPSFDSDFHVVGAVFDRVYPDGDPDHVLTGVQTYTGARRRRRGVRDRLRQGGERRRTLRVRDAQLRRRGEGCSRDHSGGRAEGVRQR